MSSLLGKVVEVIGDWGVRERISMSAAAGDRVLRWVMKGVS